MELDVLLEPVAGHVVGDLAGHLPNRIDDRVALGGFREHRDGVAHDHRRLGGVEDDDGLGRARTTHLLDGVRRRLGELVDVGAGPGPADLEAIEATISA